MVKHIVFFKFLEGKRDSDLYLLISKLRTLPGKIDFIRSYEVGADILRAGNSYDVALVSSFDSIDDLLKYKVHPAHEEFVLYLKTVCEPVKAVDYEI